MTFRVVTKGACDRCGLADERDGAEYGIPPKGWSEITINTRSRGREDSGWTNSKSTRYLTCPSCTDAVKEVVTATGDQT